MRKYVIGYLTFSPKPWILLLGHLGKHNLSSLSKVNEKVMEHSSSVLPNRDSIHISTMVILN